MAPPVRSVPFRGLAVSLMAMGAAVGGAALRPDLLLEQETIAGGLAMMPALLLAHYRRWRTVSLVLGVGLVGLTLVHLSPIVIGVRIDGPFVVLFAVAPYISVSLSAGWFGEVRRYRAELRTTQLQLIQAEKLESLGRLAAGVAHELKNPLMMLLTGVRVLATRVPAPDEAGKQVIVDMSDAIDRADRIIAGLLNYSRAGRLDAVPVDLNAVVEDSLHLVAHEITRARVTLVTRLGSSIPPVRLDFYKIEQVLVNVLTNAVHAAGPDGQICVTTALEKLTRGPHVGHRHTDRYVPGEPAAVIQVEDSGPGVPEEHLSKIFDPFFTTKAVGQGTGLGLSVARQIVEMHGGTIEIANRPEGGARVTIILKLDIPGGTL